jgi:hypothetical protein
VPKAPEIAADAVLPAKPDQSSNTKLGAVKNDSNAIKSTTLADSASLEIKTVNSSVANNKDDKTELTAERSKMEIATDIYKQMKKTKGITRKEILERFMAEAHLSKAGASTYFQLIKAKVK